MAGWFGLCSQRALSSFGDATHSHGSRIEAEVLVVVLGCPSMLVVLSGWLRRSVKMGNILYVPLSLDFLICEVEERRTHTS